MNNLRNSSQNLESWDGMMTADSHTAVVVSQMRGAFRTRILNAALGADLAKTYTWAQSKCSSIALLLSSRASGCRKILPATLFVSRFL